MTWFCEVYASTLLIQYCFILWVFCLSDLVSWQHNESTFLQTRSVIISSCELFLFTVIAVCLCAVCGGRLQCHFRLTGGASTSRSDPLQLPEFLQTLQSSQSEGRVTLQSGHEQTEETQVQAQALFTYVSLDTFSFLWAENLPDLWRCSQFVLSDHIKARPCH